MHVVMMPQWLDPPKVAGVSYVWWDHGQDHPAHEALSGVTVFVPPYMPVAEDLAPARRMPRLQAVQALMAGTDGMIPHLPDGVLVLRAVGVHDTSTAELAVGLAIAMQRDIDVAARDMAEGTWRHVRRPALADSTVAVVGWGGVGQAVARRLEPFEAHVTGFSRSGRGCQRADRFDAMLPGFDIVILAIPPDPSGPVMDAGRLAAMKRGALLVNVGRGSLVDNDALVHLLHAGRVRAALDVTDPEPLPPDHALWRCPDLLITPHVSGDLGVFTPPGEGDDRRGDAPSVGDGIAAVSQGSATPNVRRGWVTCHTARAPAASSTTSPGRTSSAFSPSISMRACPSSTTNTSWASTSVDTPTECSQMPQSTAATGTSHAPVSARPARTCSSGTVETGRRSNLRRSTRDGIAPL